MKKYKQILDVLLLVGLGTMSILAIAPNKIIMPNSLQMIVVAIVTGLIASFLLLLWRENPTDEREIFNQAQASRTAYIVGSMVLIYALIIQSIQHRLDSAVPLALFAMIVTKILVQQNRDDS